MAALVQTSEVCDQTGIYRTLCCMQDLQLRDGQRIPQCPACRRDCSLILLHDLRLRLTAGHAA